MNSIFFDKNPELRAKLATINEAISDITDTTEHSIESVIDYLRHRVMMREMSKSFHGSAMRITTDFGMSAAQFAARMCAIKEQSVGFKTIRIEHLKELEIKALDSFKVPDVIHEPIYPETESNSSYIKSASKRNYKKR